MTKENYQSCLMSLLTILGQIPGAIVYIIVLSKLDLDGWIWGLYIFGLVFGVIMSFINVLIVTSGTSKALKEAVSETVDKLIERIKKENL